MNKIEKEIIHADTVTGGGKSPARLAKEILSRLESGVPFGTTFIEEIPAKDRTRVEAVLKYRFELWANSWVAPLCRAIIAKSKK